MTTTKSPPKLSEEFKKRNATFQGATISSRRIMIAQDVLDQLKIGKIKASEGNWAIIRLNRTSVSEEQICTLLESNDVISCSCCALGAMMISEIRHTDNLAVSDVETDPDEHDNWLCLQHGDKEDRLENYFSPEQMALVEMAYELGDGAYFLTEDGVMDMEDGEAIASRRDGNKAIEFGSLHEERYDRLVAIMENIVANDGIFVP